MAELFSHEWALSFKDAWNADSELVKDLAAIGFDSTIGYGFDGEATAQCFIKIQQGEAVDAGAFHGETLNWDLRATADAWQKWISKPPGMMGLGIAYTSGKLKFALGDYGAMVKNPKMAGPFIKTFSIMAKA